MRHIERTLELITATMSGDPDAIKEYENGCDRDAIETAEKKSRRTIIEEEKSTAVLLIEAYQTIELHQSRIARATRTPQKSEVYETKLRDSIRREEKENFCRIVTAVLEQPEHTARAAIEHQAMQRYSFFDTKHKEIAAVIHSQQQGFHIELPELCDENGFVFVTPPPSATI